MEAAHLERQYRSEIEELRRSVEARLNILERPPRATVVLGASPNYLPNSHPEWSVYAYTGTGTTPDDEERAYNWFFQETGETILSNSGTVTADQGPLVASGHPNFATVDGDAPIWDKVNGTFRLGWETSGYDVACPLPTDFVFPGQRYFICFETLAEDDALDLQDAEFYCGFWDTTTGQEKWIEGAEFEPDIAVYGVPGTRTLSYKVRATTDGNNQILSKEVTVATAPATLTPENHVRLFFRGVAGFLQFEVFRKDGTTYRKVADIRNSIDLQFFDMQESGGSLEDGYPTLTLEVPRAYAQTNGLAANNISYTVHTMVVEIPTTYDKSNTDSNKQWFRFGLTGAVSNARGLVLRRIMVSEGYGPWTRSINDMQAINSPSTSATVSPGTGILTGEFPSNGPYCVSLDTLVDVIDRIDEQEIVTKIAIKNITQGMHVACGAQALPVLEVRDGTVQETYCIVTVSGLELQCSASHRLIQSRFDKHGRAAKSLKPGDHILISKDGAVTAEAIAAVSVVAGATPVRTLVLPKPHIYVTNGFISHNDKRPEGPEIVFNQV